MNSDNTRGAHNGIANGVAAPDAKEGLKNARVVLALLEADQIVAAKRQSRFGRQKLSLGTRAMLWGLRVYVFVMLVIVLVSILHAVRPGR